MNLDAVANLKVLVLGDAIMDEYVYVNPLGKSIKDNMISTQFVRKETYRGGAWVGAEHIRDFSPQVESMVGPNITTNRRFVEEAYTRKLFVVHETIPLTGRVERPFPAYDLVVVTDFGHGCLNPETIEKVCKEAKYLAVNTQTNTSNYGFNLITKYPRADYVVLDELEARLATHDRYSPLEDIIKKLGFKKIIVTQGYKGAIGYDGEQFYQMAASASKVVDTMGAGDAFLCVSSLFASLGWSIPDLLSIGNAAAAVKVSIIGHRTSVTKEAMTAYL